MGDRHKGPQKSNLYCTGYFCAAPKQQAAFTLIEAAVAIAIVAILAGAIAPLTVKILNQQREAKTRDSLKAAFEGMFGARDRRVANMLADFGFAPTSTLSSLPVLVARPASGSWSTVPTYTQDVSGLFWGYNGPYWSGAVVGGRPVDAWGRPIRLSVVGTAPSQTWQATSVGANGADESGAGDDLVYPATPAGARSYTGVINLNISNSSNRTGNVTVWARSGGATLAQVGSTYTLVASPPTQVYNPAAGGTVIKVVVTGTGAGTYYYIVDLLPGEVRDFSLSVP
jgi:prepilin-type N-terminal cleavage/methylation domain-containing protein